MKWQEPVIDYCERLDHGFWSEPLNALTNAAFLIAAAAAFLLLHRRQAGDDFALALILVTAAVGVGSFIFHTVATRGAVLLDILPIAVFIYGYFFLALRRFFGVSKLASSTITVLFGCASYFVETSFDGLNGSIGYLPALAAMASFAVLLRAGVGSQPTDRASRHRSARGFAIAALTFAVSLGLRTVDRQICSAFPPGTHFLWHLLNAFVLWLLLRTIILAKARIDTAD